MDFIVNLPVSSHGYDGIFTIVDRFSRLVRFIPINSNILAVEVGKLSLINGCVNMVFHLRSSVIAIQDFNLLFGKVYVSASIHV
jgi:hypothetical protein